MSWRVRSALSMLLRESRAGALGSSRRSMRGAAVGAAEEAALPAGDFGLRRSSPGAAAGEAEGEEEEGDGSDRCPSLNGLIIAPLPLFLLIIAECATPSGQSRTAGWRKAEGGGERLGPEKEVEGRG